MRDETLQRALKRYDLSPHLVFWETTKACSLACRHCRASAQTEALPGELSTDEGRDLIDQIAAMEGAVPILVFTGGDCFERADLESLVGYARSRGVRVGIAPSVTKRLTRENLRRMYELGVRSISISLDGSGPQSHDAVRGIPGHFDQTMAALAMMRDMGFRLQVNTTVMNRNAHELADVLSLLRSVGVAIWEVFFLVGVGRGVDVQEISARDAEDVCHFLVDATTFGMTVRTVEAPFFRRVQAEREVVGGEDPVRAFTLGPPYATLRQRLDEEDRGDVRTTRSHSLATGDGRGIIFVGHDGEVHASGFLPVTLGNIRQTPLGEIYQSNPLLTAIRAGDLEGGCGRCDFYRLCGGSRARAYVRTGSVLGEDPLCIRSDAAKRIPLAPR